MKTLSTLLLTALLSLTLTAQTTSDAKATKLLAGAEKALGGWNPLYAKGDVQYTYDYSYPATGKTDLSTERYIFEGEHSWARYTKHDVNVAPDKEGGTVTQAFVDGKPYAMVDGKATTDPKLVGTAGFLRQANYFWFTMFYKFDDPGVIAKYDGTETVNGTKYDVVNVTYDAAVTGKESNDAYILYVNPKTKLVDRFFFSLPAMGVNAPVILMELDYTTVDGIQVVTKRRVYQPGADGKLSETPNLVQTLTDMTFGNGFTAADFMQP